MEKLRPLLRWLGSRDGRGGRRLDRETEVVVIAVAGRGPSVACGNGIRAGRGTRISALNHLGAAGRRADLRMGARRRGIADNNGRGLATFWQRRCRACGRARSASRGRC